MLGPSLREVTCHHADLRVLLQVPLLQEVLQSACFIPHAKLVIEIKPSITDVCGMLIDLFRSHPEFVQKTAVVMTFDLYLIHAIKAKYDEAIRQHIESLAVAEWDFSGAHPGLMDHPKFLWLSCDPTNADNQAKIEAGKWRDCDYLMDIEDTQEFLKMIQRDTSKLDGVYLQYNPDYLTIKRPALDRLVEQCCVGMWDVTPDSEECCQALADAGVTFFNTDLPKTFLCGGGELGELGRTVAASTASQNVSLEEEDVDDGPQLGRSP